MKCSVISIAVLLLAGGRLSGQTQETVIVSLEDKRMTAEGTRWHVPTFIFTVTGPKTNEVYTFMLPVDRGPGHALFELGRYMEQNGRLESDELKGVSLELARLKPPRHETILVFTEDRQKVVEVERLLTHRLVAFKQKETSNKSVEPTPTR